MDIHKYIHGYNTNISTWRHAQEEVKRNTDKKFVTKEYEGDVIWIPSEGAYYWINKYKANNLIKHDMINFPLLDSKGYMDDLDGTEIEIINSFVKKQPPKFDETKIVETKIECKHDWVEVFGLTKSLGWNCKLCEMKKEDLK